MKVLVTGGAGFIGSHVARKLLERGDSVVIVDNFNDYYDVNLKKKRLEQLKGNFKFLKGDISDLEFLKKVFNEKFDAVVHLAAQAGVRYSIENPHVYVKSNLAGFVNVLEMCREFKVDKVVFASSSSVYGNNTKLPFSENDRVDTPISLYAATKKNNEEIAHVYYHLFKINCTGLRFFTVYGPYGRPDMALFLFTEAILNNKEIKVFNNGDMVRDFTFVDDIVDGVILSLDKCKGFNVFNLGRGEKVKLLDFILEIEKNLGMEAKKKFLPLQQGDVLETSADISKAKKLLGYNPKVNVKEGVKKFIDWYKEYYLNENIDA